jgi:D-xylose transport system permease protein
MTSDATDSVHMSALRAKAGRARDWWVQAQLGALPVILGLAFIWTYFEIEDSHFLSSRNLSNLLLQIAVTATLSIGVVYVLLLGAIDLSIGSLSGVTAAVLGVLVVEDGVVWWQAIVVMLAVGAAIGAFQGLWVAVARVPSFIVTLAGLLGLLGLQLHVLGAAGSLNIFDPSIAKIANTYLPRWAGWGVSIGVIVLFATSRYWSQARRRRAGLQAANASATVAASLIVTVTALGAVAVLDRANGVPTAAAVMFGLVAFFDMVARHTRFGRHVYAVGGNAEAARRAGINVARIRILVFSLSGLLAAIGGLIQASRGAAAGVQTGGGTLLLEAIAAAVIGGTSLFGGRGRVWSALLGALVIGSVSNGLDLIGQPSDVKYMVEGMVLLGAVTVDSVTRRGRGRAEA